MINIENMHKKHFDDLTTLLNKLKKLDYNVSLIENSKEIALNTLVGELLEDSKNRKRYVSFAFTPFDEEIQYSKFLQVYSDINTVLNDNNYMNILNFINTINCSCVIGHFVINNNTIGFRYTFSLENKTLLDNNYIIESLSLFLFSLDMYSEIIESLADNNISLQEAINKINKKD